MSEENKHIEEKIERYLKGVMPEAERVLFQSEIRLDATLYEKVLLQKTVRELILKAGLDDIRLMMQKDLKPQNKNGSWGSHWLGVILVIVFSGLAGYFYYSKMNTVKPVSEKEAFRPTTSSVTKSIQKEDGIPQELQLKPDPPKRVIVNEVIIQNTGSSVPPATAKELQKEEISSAQTQTSNIPQQPQNTSGKEEKSDLCADFKPNFEWKTVPCVADEANGKIIVITSDKTLSFALEGEELSTNNNFENLTNGTYHLQVTNADGCRADGGNINLVKTFCKGQVQDIFNVQNDERYLLTAYPEEATKAWVYDKTMKEVAHSDLRFNVSWDGRNQNGQPVAQGLYKVEVHYKNGDKCFHTVTVFD